MDIKRWGILGFIVLAVVIFQHISYATPSDLPYPYDSVAIRVKNIEYRYRPSGEEPFFLREVKKFERVLEYINNGRVVGTHTDETTLRPGERIIDYLFNIGYEGSFLFYADDRGLTKLFASIDSSRADFNNSGRLSESITEGRLLRPLNGDSTATLKRSAFKYDANGRLKAYSADLIYQPSRYWLGFKLYQADYDLQNKIIGFIYGDGTYGYWEKYKVYNIVYNRDGELVSCVTKLLSTR
jgi:hypothetical protein